MLLWQGRRISVSRNYLSVGPGGPVSQMDTTYVTIKRFPIRLGQFLKRASIVSDGVEGKLLIKSGVVLVNGQQEVRRGRKLVRGDQITVENATYVCHSSDI